MASINAATLAVKLQADTRPLQRDLRKGERSISRSGSRMGRIAAAASAAIVSGLALAGAASIKAASDVEELQAKSEAVFGDLTRDVESWAASFADATGRSRFALQGFAATIQDTLVPMGFARGRAAEMSKQVSELAVDLGSLNNVSAERMLNNLQSALVGNGRAMLTYGVQVNAARTEQELLTMGIEGGTQAATEQEKIMARLRILMSDSADAQGDAARTAGSFANQTRALGSQVRELAVELGQELLPAATATVGILTDLTRGLRESGVSLTGLATAAGGGFVLAKGLSAASRSARDLFGRLARVSAAASKARTEAGLFPLPEIEQSAKTLARGPLQKLIAAFGVLSIKIAAVVAVAGGLFLAYRTLVPRTDELSESVEALGNAYGVLEDEAEGAESAVGQVVSQVILEDSKKAAQNIIRLREEIEKLQALRDRGVGGGTGSSGLVGFTSPVGAGRDLEKRQAELQIAQDTIEEIQRRVRAQSDVEMFGGLLGTDLSSIEEDSVALLRAQQETESVLNSLGRALAQNARQREEATDPAFREALDRDREQILRLKDAFVDFNNEIFKLSPADFESLKDLNDQLDSVQDRLETTTDRGSIVTLTAEEVRLAEKIERLEQDIARARVEARAEMPKTQAMLRDQIGDLQTLEEAASSIQMARYFRRERENAEQELEALQQRIKAFVDDIERVEVSFFSDADRETIDRIEAILAGRERFGVDDLGRRGVPEGGGSPTGIGDKELAKLQLANQALGQFNQGLQSAIIQGQSLGDAMVASLKAVIAQLTAAVAQALILKGIMASMGMTDSDAQSAGFFGVGFTDILSTVLGLSTPFASGGLAFGPALGLVGEGPGISKSNPEVIAPLSKLQSFMEQGGGGGGTQRIEIVPRALPGGDIGWAVDETRRVSERFR